MEDCKCNGNRMNFRLFPSSCCRGHPYGTHVQTIVVIFLLVLVQSLQLSGGQLLVLSEYVGVGGVCNKGDVRPLGSTACLHPRVERSCFSSVALSQPVLRGGRSPVVAGLH